MTFDQALHTVADGAIHQWVRDTNDRHLRQAIEVVMDHQEAGRKRVTVTGENVSHINVWLRPGSEGVR